MQCCTLSLLHAVQHMHQLRNSKTEFTTPKSLRIMAEHVLSRLNTAVDVLSRDYMSHFFTFVHQTAAVQSLLSALLIDLLLSNSAAWTS